MSLRPDETRITGSWIMKNGRMVEDEAARRIQKLVSEELILIGASDGGWSRLYRDERDGRYWELNYPQGHTQSGGPPCLRLLTPDLVADKYPLGK